MSWATRVGSWSWSVASAVARRARGGHGARLGVRVVSVGNLQAGGAGKTPLVALVAQEAQERGIETCILTRGYRGNWEKTGGILRPGDPADPNLAGDEATLLHELAPRAWIGIGSDRCAQYQQVLEAGARPALVVLDDGFQNHQIQKDIEIVAVTSRAPSDVLYRDFPSELQNADLTVWTKGAEAPAFLGPSHVRAAFELTPSTEKVWLVAGVADPEAAVESVRRAGYDVQRVIAEGDHTRYPLPRVQELLGASRNNGCRIALTGKDWVKWKALGVTSSEVLVLEPQVRIVEGREKWEKILWGP